MKQVFSILFSLFCLNATFAQHHNIKNSKSSDNQPKSYISIDDYREVYKKSPEVKDPENFMVIHGDTLIAISSGKKRSIPFEYKDENFLNIYKTVAFNGNYKNKDGKSYLKYWKTGLKIYFSESVSSSTQKSLKKFAKEISEGVDSLNISFVNDIKKANYIIYFNGDFEYNPNLEKSDAEYYINWNGKNQITKGFIKLNRTVYFNETLINEKMQQLFLESLGYFKTTNKLNCNSFFSNCNDSEKKFGALDKEILKYHYSYGICKGIDEETFDALHEKAKNHKKNHPEIPYSVVHIEQ